METKVTEFENTLLLTGIYSTFLEPVLFSFGNGVTLWEYLWSKAARQRIAAQKRRLHSYSFTLVLCSGCFGTMSACLGLVISWVSCLTNGWQYWALTQAPRLICRREGGRSQARFWTLDLKVLHVVVRFELKFKMTSRITLVAGLVLNIILDMECAFRTKFEV